MKRIFSILAACATMFALAACQEELQQPVEEQKPVLEGIEGELQEVTFSVNLEDKAQTKAISDGLSANQLEYAVYYAEQGTLDEDKQDVNHSSKYKPGDYIEVLSTGKNAKIEKSGDRTWKVTLTLAKNVKYDIVFWAYAKDAPYTFDEANAKIIVNDYEGAANAEIRDAFYGLCKGYSVISSEERVELRRPFAQINFGACDYIPYVTDLGLEVTSTIDTKDHEPVDAVYDSNGRLLYAERPAVAQCTVPNTLHVLDGTVSGEAVVKFQLADIPFKGGDKVLLTAKNAEDEIPYHWMGMNYILAGPEATINNIHATFHYNGQDLVFDVPNVPYKRNYKTNIIGNLFTENAKFNVVVLPEYENEIIIKDGQAYDMPEINGNEYIVKTSMELAWIADQVNSGLNDFAGKTVSIASDINLSNYDWTPIGTDANPFKGTIQPHEAQTKSAAAAFSISGLKVNHTEGPAGLVGVLNGGAVKNITLVEPVVNGKEFVGAVVGKIFPEGLVEGVTVTGGQVNGNHFVGGLVGHAYGSVKNCVVDGTVVTGTSVEGNDDLNGDKVGGVIGYHAPDADGTEVSGNVVKNVTVSAKRDAGLVAGAANANNVFGNKVESGAVEATGDNVDVVVGRVLEGTLDPMSNEYSHKDITVNGVQAAAPAYVFAATADEQAIPAKGGSYTIAVAGNVAWSVVVPEGLAATPAKGKGPADVVVAVPENTLYEAVSYVVKVATEVAVEIAEYTFTIQQEAAEKPAITVTAIKDVIPGDKEYTVEGVVVAVGVNGYVVADDAAIFVYGQNHGRKLNEKVQLTGVVSQKYKNNVMQFSSPAVTVLEETATYTYSPKSVDGSAIDAAVASGTATCEEVTFMGILSVSGEYVNITIDGGTKQGSLKYITASDYASLASKKVIVKGYVTSTYNYYSVLPYSVELAPKEYTDWYLMGINGDWSTGIQMEKYDNGDDYGVIYNLEVAANQNFKFKNAGDWFGYWDVLTPSTEYVAGVDGGNAMFISAGTYDVYFATDKSHYVVLPVGSALPSNPYELGWTWRIVGTNNGWQANETATPFVASGDVLVAKAVVFADAVSFKILERTHDWNYSLCINGNQPIIDGKPANLKVNGDNIVPTTNGSTGLPAGTYDLYLDPLARTLSIKSYVEAPAVVETTAKVVMKDLGFANSTKLKEIKMDDNVTLTFAKGNSTSDPAYYNEAVRLYQNGATLTVNANGKTIKSIKITFAENQYYIAADSGEFTEEGAVRTWTGEAESVKFTTTGTDKNHRAYVSAIEVTYE